MYEELLTLKAEAEHEMLYAKAKIEVADKLLAKMQPIVAPIEEETVELEAPIAEDTELEDV